MQRDDIIACLKKSEPELRCRGIASLFLFGSYARDEARPDSDIDLLAEVAPDTQLSILDMLDAQAVIEAGLPDKEIFFVTRENIVPVYLPSIEETALKVF
jgi:predicted nucleotidyltransferase